jgi:hypothetical protein
MNRRKLLQTSFALAAGTLAGLGLAAQPARPVVEVWKTASCGCCHDWIKHLQDQGFEVQTHDVSNATKNDYRRRLGLADKFGSCHTALVSGYVIEGHVPAREIRRLLKDKPRALGLAVPGMPIGSPGMDGPDYGGHKDAYDVLLVQRGGTASVFQSYR